MTGVQTCALPICFPVTIDYCFPVTILSAVKLPLYSGGQRCIFSYRGGSGGNLYVGKNSGGIFCFYNELNNAGYTVGSITDNTIAIVAIELNYSGNSITTTINGSKQTSATRTGWVSAYNTVLNLGYDAGGTTEYRDWETDRKSTRLNSSHRL